MPSHHCGVGAKRRSRGCSARGKVVEEGRQLVEEVLGVHRPIVCTYDPIVSAEHDLERVVELRRSSLERAGYDREAAHTLAEHVEIPLQEALALRRAGLPPDVALELLTSGDRPVF